MNLTIDRKNILLQIDEPHEGEVETPDQHRPDEVVVVGDPEYVKSGEDRYWREWYDTHSYYGRNYDEFQPAFQYGWESARNPEYAGKSFEQIEPELMQNWAAYNGMPRNDWHYMRWAVFEAFQRARRMKR